ncbi:MAG: GNAT family N-acetyltransferase [Anaerolineae bacterium]|nr:GNAT family N-acetyltransferase [Anaerolineae bacterium]
MSLTWQGRYQPSREPDRVLRRMTPDDIPGALALTQRVGWQKDAAHWGRLLYWSPDGCFVLDEEESGIVGTVSTTSYGTALAWIGMVLVAPERQRLGLGRQLMRAALDHLIARGTERIMLDSTDAGRRLYQSMGFRAVGKIERWEGRASTYLGPRAQRMDPVDREAVFAFDRTAFGLDRSHILGRLMDESPDMTWVDYQGGALEGYLLAHRHGSSVLVGPWMSRTIASAERLLLLALERLQGQPIVINIPDNNGRSLILASDHNLSRMRQCTRMIYGDAVPVPGEPLTELAVGMLATG